MENFQQIDIRRVAAKVTRKALYERAGVHKETWRRLSAGTSLGSVKTLQRLSSALDQLQEGKGDGAN